MEPEPASPDERYAALVERMLATTGATRSGKGFGASSLKVGGRIFAMLAGGRLVVRLPAPRVDALVVGGDGERYDPRRDGRLMKEWLALDPASELEWPALATEAMTFVASTA